MVEVQGGEPTSRARANNNKYLIGEKIGTSGVLKVRFLFLFGLQ